MVEAVPGAGQVLLACSMLEDEIALALQNTGVALPVQWLERGLHEVPATLRTELAAAIEAQPPGSTVLLGYTLCGNALVGLGSRACRLVAPRFHDCIQLGLALRPGVPPAMDSRCLYFTRGWLLGDQSMTSQYERTRQKYGDTLARQLYGQILGGYTRFDMLDNGAYNLNAASPVPKALAAQFGKDFGVQAGTVRVLEKLLRGEWDEEFCVKEPGRHFEQRDFFD